MKTRLPIQAESGSPNVCMLFLIKWKHPGPHAPESECGKAKQPASDLKTEDQCVGELCVLFIVSSPWSAWQ